MKNHGIFCGSSYGPFNGRMWSKPAADTAAATEAQADTTAAVPEDTAAVGTDAAAPAAGKKYVINTDTTFAPFEFENDKGDGGIDLDILEGHCRGPGI